MRALSGSDQRLRLVSRRVQGARSALSAFLPFFFEFLDHLTDRCPQLVVVLALFINTRGSDAPPDRHPGFRVDRIKRELSLANGVGLPSRARSNADTEGTWRGNADTDRHATVTSGFGLGDV